MTNLTPIQCPLCKGEGQIKPTSLGNVLQIKRHELNKSMTDVAEATGISLSTISRVESGAQPDFQNGLAIAKWCGLSGDDLMSLGASND